MAGPDQVSAQVYQGALTSVQIRVFYTLGTGVAPADPNYFLSSSPQKEKILRAANFPTTWFVFNCTFVGQSLDPFGRVVLEAILRFTDGSTNVFIGPPGGSGTPGLPGPPGPPGPPGAGAAVDSVVPFNCLAGVSVNDCVYCDALDNVARANASSLVTAPAVGFVINKPTPITAIVRYYGELPGFVGLVPTAEYYLDVVSGQISINTPNVQGNIRQAIGFARSTTVLSIMINREYIIL